MFEILVRFLTATSLVQLLAIVMHERVESKVWKDRYAMLYVILMLLLWVLSFVLFYEAVMA